MPAEGGHPRPMLPASGFAALDAMVRPRSVAIIGASDDATRIGGRQKLTVMTSPTMPHCSNGRVCRLRLSKAIPPISS